MIISHTKYLHLHLNDAPVIGDQLLGRDTEGGVANHGLDAPDQHCLYLLFIVFLFLLSQNKVLLTDDNLALYVLCHLSSQGKTRILPGPLAPENSNK